MQFTLSTTVQNVTLQYGLRKFYQTDSGTVVTSARFGASATFFGLDDNIINVYSPMVSQSNFKVNTGDAVDAIYKLWLLAEDVDEATIPVFIFFNRPGPDEPMADWSEQSLYYDCYLNDKETWTPMLAIFLPS